MSPHLAEPAHARPSEARTSDFSKVGSLSKIHRKGLLKVIAGGPRKSQNVSGETEGRHLCLLRGCHPRRGEQMHPAWGCGEAGRGVDMRVRREAWDAAERC